MMSSHGVEHAVLLVGGRGTRLQPLTDTRPKPMLPILDAPFLEHQLAHLRRHGIRSVTFACGFLPSAIVDHFGEGDSIGMRLTYAIEPAPLDTAGAIAFAARTVDRQRLLACNGDVLTDLDLGRLLEFHAEREACATIALTPVDDPSRYGLVRTDAHGAVTAFVEKPPPDQCDTNLINAGTYILEPTVIDMIPSDERCNIEREIFPQLVGRGLHALGSEGYWKDIGTFESYIEANIDMLSGAVAGASEWTQASDGMPRSSIAADAAVSDGAHIDHPVYIGAGASVAAGARLGPNSVIAAGARVDEGASVVGSIVLEGAYVGSGATLDRAIVGEGGTVPEGATLHPMDVISPGLSTSG